MDIDAPLFIWVKNKLELKILIYILRKEWSYDCKSVIHSQINFAQWFKINRLRKKLEKKTYWDMVSTSSNTIMLKRLNKDGPFTKDECLTKKIDSILFS